MYQPIKPEGGIKVFISYAYEDLDLRKKLEQHLSPLKYSGKITIWQDQEIPAGVNWEDQVNTHLGEADIVLLLISASFIASKYCWSKEVQAALKRHNAGTVRVIPIILKSALWQDTPLGQLQALPRGDKAVTEWDKPDAALTDVVRGIRDVVKDLQSRLQGDVPAKQKIGDNLMPSLPAEEKLSGELQRSAYAVQASHEQASRPAPDSRPEVLVRTPMDKDGIIMDAAPFTTLTNQVIKIRTSFSHDSEAGRASTSGFGEDARQQGKRMYETVLTRFNRETDGGSARRLLDNFIDDPEGYSYHFQKKLISLLQADPDFAKKLRHVVSLPLFIGRDQELQEYVDFLSQDAPWIWTLTGLEGSGKSSLLDQMKKKTPSPDVLVIKFDFASGWYKYDSSTGERKPADALDCLAGFVRQLKMRCDLQKYTDFEKELKKAYDEDSDNIKEIDEYLPKVRQSARQEARNRKRSRMTFAFHELMDSFKPNHLVIQLDTCELLMESVNVEVREWLFQDILLPLHESMHQRQKRCHVVMMSTVVLPLPLRESDERKQSSLDPLGKQPVEQYLQRIGIDDSKLRSHLYNMTDRHAKCVFILRELWLQWEKEGKQISDVGTLIQFQKEFYEKAEKEFIEKHILAKFPKMPLSPLRDLTRYGILLRTFNLPLLEAVFSDFLAPFSASQAKMWFDQFTSLSYIIPLGAFNYAILGLLRTVLGYSIRMQQPDLWKKYHEHAMNFFKNQIDPIRLARSSDWHYHRLAFYLVPGPNEGLSKHYWIETLASLEEEGIIPPNPLLEAACDKTLIFTSVAFEAQKYIQKRGS